MITLATTTKAAFLNKYNTELLPLWHAINPAQVSAVTISVDNLNDLINLAPNYALLKVRMVEKEGQIYPLFNLTNIEKEDLLDNYYDLNKSLASPVQISSADFAGYVQDFDNGQLKAAMASLADHATQAIFVPANELSVYLYSAAAISADNFVDIELEYNQIDLTAPLLNLIPALYMDRIINRSGYFNIIFTALDAAGARIANCSYNVNHLCPPGCE